MVRFYCDKCGLRVGTGEVSSFFVKRGVLKAERGGQIDLCESHALDLVDWPARREPGTWPAPANGAPAPR